MPSTIHIEWDFNVFGTGCHLISFDLILIRIITCVYTIKNWIKCDNTNETKIETKIDSCLAKTGNGICVYTHSGNTDEGKGHLRMNFGEIRL